MAGIPAFRTSFVGRERELASLRGLLAHERLVSITGAGGGGKTRLAARLAARLASERPAHWVELQALTGDDAVASAAAVSCGALRASADDALNALTAHLGDERRLLVLDNCEHVLDGVARVVDRVLDACPQVTVLTTTRTPLALADEIAWPLPALDETAAHDLFVERARRVDPAFAPDEVTGPAVRRLCRSLDGSPLAIELAAAWARTLTVEQIESGLEDRFALLVGGPRGSVPRHRTLAASLDWSWDLLDDGERRALAALAVFVGPFDLDAALSVLGPGALAPLDGLVAASLVAADDTGRARTFRLLETVRRYAWRRLETSGDLTGARERHLEHHLAVAEAAEPLLDTDKDEWRAVVEPHLDDIRAALAWGLAQADPARGRRLAAATAWLWNLRGRGREGVDVIRRAIACAPAERSQVQARLLWGFALIGDTAAPDELDPVRAGADLADELDDERLRGRFRTLLAVGEFYRDFDAAWRRCDTAREAAGRAGDDFGSDAATALQGLILHLRDRHEEASDLLRTPLDRMIRRGDRGIASTLLAHESAAAWSTGETTRAGDLAEHAAAVAAPLGDHHRVGTTYGQLALVRGLHGDIDGGLRLLEPFVRRVRSAGPRVFVPGMARTLGTLHLWRGDPEEAARWLTPDAPATGPGAGTHLDALGLPVLAEALRHLGRGTDAVGVLDRAERIARHLGMPRVLADVADQRALLAAGAGEAADLHHEALAIRVTHGLWTDTVASLELLARRMTGSGRADVAARIHAAAGSARERLDFPRPPSDAAAAERWADEVRETLGHVAFAEQTAAGAGMTLEDAVALVRRSRGPRGRPSAGWASLTPTERDVVRCVVDGRTNPQIAARLFMSRGTVKAHLARVFRKLDVANRTELASLAADHARDRSDA